MLGVPPMIRTAASAPSNSHLPTGRWRLTILRGGCPMSGRSLIVSVIVVTAICQRPYARPEDADGS